MKWVTISVKPETLKFLKQLKKNKGFHSLEELIYNTTKACEYFTKLQILRLAAIHVSTLPPSEFDKRFPPETEFNFEFPIRLKGEVKNE